MPFNSSSCKIICNLILKGIPMVWYTLAQLTYYCCSENVSWGMVIAPSSQQDTVLLAIILIVFDTYEKVHVQAKLNYFFSIRFCEVLANTFPN